MQLGKTVSGSLQFWNAVDDYMVHHRKTDVSETIRHLVNMGWTYEQKMKEDLANAPSVEAVP